MIVHTGPIVLVSCPSRLALPQASLDRLGDRDALRQRERDGGVDADPLLQWPLRWRRYRRAWPGSSRSCSARARRSAAPVCSERRGVTVEARIGLDRESPVTPAVLGEDAARGAPRPLSTATPPRPSASSSSVAAGCWRLSDAMRWAPLGQVRLDDDRAITGLQVAPTEPCSRAVRRSSRAAESLHKHVGVVCVISCNGLFQRCAGSGRDWPVMGADVNRTLPRLLQTFASGISAR